MWDLWCDFFENAGIEMHTRFTCVGGGRRGMGGEELKGVGVPFFCLLAHQRNSSKPAVDRIEQQRSEPF